MLNFTGSPEVGWTLKAKAGKKKVVLELGGNAACIVDAYFFLWRGDDQPSTEDDALREGGKVEP